MSSVDDDFYVTLPSNVISTNKENNLSHWTTQLPSWINFSSEYEVGLTEFSYTNSWYNIVDPQQIRLVYVPDDRARENKNWYLPTRTKTLHPCRVFTLETLITMINERIRLIPMTWRIEPKVERRRFGVEVINGFDAEERVWEIEFDDELNKILGVCCSHEYDEDGIPIPHGILYGEIADLSGGLHSIYVYTDIIKHCHVGNTMAQLLRRVDIKDSKFGTQVNNTFPSVYYHPLKDRSIGSIEILLKDDSGRLISFRSGRSIVTLHFRKILRGF